MPKERLATRPDRRSARRSLPPPRHGSGCRKAMAGEQELAATAIPGLFGALPAVIAAGCRPDVLMYGRDGDGLPEPSGRRHLLSCASGRAWVRPSFAPPDTPMRRG